MQLAPSYSTINGERCYSLTVTQGKQTQIHYFSTKTGLRVAMAMPSEDPTAPARTISYSDYRSVNGVLFPHSVVVPLGPGMNLEFKTTQLLINSNVADSFFK
jgi:hypothetical protein